VATAVRGERDLPAISDYAGQPSKKGSWVRLRGFEASPSATKTSEEEAENSGLRKEKKIRKTGKKLSD
jgi:hypothetical protein